MQKWNYPTINSQNVLSPTAGEIGAAAQKHYSSVVLVAAPPGLGDLTVTACSHRNPPSTLAHAGNR